MPTKTAKIFLVDDHPLIRSGLTAVLKTDPSLTVCGEAASSSEAFAKLASVRPDIVITDLNLGSILEGLDFIRALHSRFPDFRILVNSSMTKSFMENGRCGPAQTVLFQKRWAARNFSKPCTMSWKAAW